MLVVSRVPVQRVMTDVPSSSQPEANTPRPCHPRAYQRPAWQLAMMSDSNLYGGSLFFLNEPVRRPSDSEMYQANWY